MEFPLHLLVLKTAPSFLFYFILFLRVYLSRTDGKQVPKCSARARSLVALGGAVTPPIVSQMPRPLAPTTCAGITRGSRREPAPFAPELVPPHRGLCWSLTPGPIPGLWLWRGVGTSSPASWSCTHCVLRSGVAGGRRPPCASPRPPMRVCALAHARARTRVCTPARVPPGHTRLRDTALQVSSPTGALVRFGALQGAGPSLPPLCGASAPLPGRVPVAPHPAR